VVSMPAAMASWQLIMQSLSVVNFSLQIQAKIGDAVYNHGKKNGYSNNYLDFKPTNKFGNRVQVPSSGYKSLIRKSDYASVPIP